MMIVFDIFGQGELHEYYPLKKPLFINKKLFNEVAIWQHYKIKHGNYITDEIILQLASQLNNTDYPQKSEGYLKTNDGRMWRGYQHDKFYIDNKAYRLVWLIKDGFDTLHIVHCLRRDQYDIKNKL